MSPSCLKPGTVCRTVIDEATARHFEAVVNDAVAGGALHPQAVLDRVDPAMTVVLQETFGPVSPVSRLGSLEEAIRLANGTSCGLSSSVCTNRLDDITRFVRELHVGSINLREVPGYRLERTPFGGIKDSGLGHEEGVLEAVKSFIHTKTCALPWTSP